MDLRESHGHVVRYLGKDQPLMHNCLLALCNDPIKGSSLGKPYIRVADLTHRYFPAITDAGQSFPVEPTTADPIAILESVPLAGCTIGSDPEVFAVDGKGTIIPAFKFLPSKDKGRTFWDGFQAEFLTDPSKRGNHCCLSYLVDEVHYGLEDVYLKAKNADKDATLTYKSVLDIPDEIMRSSHPKYLELGCSPSKNVYGLPPIHVDDPYMLRFRFAGCHFHFGIRMTEKETEHAVKALDAVLGVISVSLFQGMEDERRRQFYGRAGEYRTPLHGLEYRVISSAVLAHPVLFHLCYDVARAALHIGKDIPLNLWWDTREEEVVHTINFYHVKQAKDILKRNKKVLQGILHRKFGAGHAEWAYRLMYHGAKKMLPVDEMVKNWRISDGTWINHSEADNCCLRQTDTTQFPVRRLKKKEVII